MVVPNECAWDCSKYNHQGYEQKSDLIITYKAQEICWQDLLYLQKATKAQQGKQAATPPKKSRQLEQKLIETI